MDAAAPGTTVWVTNGVYDSGIKAYYSMSNRVVIGKAVTVQSVNGPGATWIKGLGVGTGATNHGTGSIRCAFVLSNAVLSGFTLTNGHESWGGGVACDDGGVVSNCVMIGNSSNSGGGACWGTLYHCILTNNFASGTGYLDGYGGGSWGGTLNNCILTGNYSFRGGGSYGGSLYNCTLTCNTAFEAGGSYMGTLNNCIVYNNTAYSDPNYSLCTFNYSCTVPLPPGTGNITNEPMFVHRLGGNLRLLPGSPCVDAGDDSLVPPGAVDLDGKPRILGAHVDMGAYELVADTHKPALTGLLPWTNTVARGDNVSVTATLEPNSNPASFQWLFNGTTFLPGQTSSNLSLNGVRLNDAGIYSVVASNLNGAVTGAVLTLQVLLPMARPVLTRTNSHFRVDVESELGRACWLEWRTNLGAGEWQAVTGATNIEGWTGLVDTNTSGPQRFYRIKSVPWP